MYDTEFSKFPYEAVRFVSTHSSWQQKHLCVGHISMSEVGAELVID